MSVPTKDGIPFSLSYNALKMFGRQLYSNAWAAISELVANGFDASAEDVYLYIDMTNKNHSIIELFDNGSGMTTDDLETKYTIIGRNRRTDNPDDKATGRKGIGKLAALYLSDCYKIITRKDDETTAWSVDVANMADNDTPRLKNVGVEDVPIVCSDIWNNGKFKTGTLIQIHDVNLERLGDAAIEALKLRLSNYFLFGSMNNKLQVCIIKNGNEKLKFEPIVKNIAFDNMSSIRRSSPEISLGTTTDNFTVSFLDKNFVPHTFSQNREINPFPATVKNKFDTTTISLVGEAEFYGKKRPYALVGWIGIHSSIDKDSAQSNDKRYVKNQFYNPNQIRVYVRNKLASESILDKLGLVATYTNYIEGEVSFEILDDNEFEDIATANRQDFSVEDDRVKLLIILLRGVCTTLLSERQKLADETTRRRNVENAKITASEKTGFTRDIREDIAQSGVEDSVADDLALVIGNKLKGDFELKTSYKLFISHATKDRIFTDFIAHYLKFRGFKFDPNNLKQTDIFYSSDGISIENLKPLSKIIKSMILDNNTDILFFSSKNFLKSQFCLFEGGAAWATRAIYKYSLISVDYNSIPKFLTNGKVEFTFDSANKDSFTLTEQNYSNLVKILNRAIKHLNNNKLSRGETTVELIPIPIIPDAVQRKKDGNKAPQDYMDKDILEYWQTYVIDNIDKYLISYKSDV